ncbi:MAG: tyrosine-type recombinase/integrase [Pirellulaceae bacterium]|nr:tyrosine-type recombinase/integrase [Pirellulaceae bacterium]HJN12556.1 tyrosine-type recombinase/integrase [Pirellulaceae bacterium]
MIKSKTKTILMRVDEYLSLRRQLGYKLVREGYLLREFGRYVDESSHRGPITAELVLHWVRLPENAAQNYLAQRLQVVRRFVRHLALEDPRTEIPSDDSLKLRRVQPHIYTKQQISDLLTAAAALSPSGGLRPQSYYTLFGLLASTGMRIGEAIRLQREEVDLKEGTLRVVNSKFSKSRLVPVHDSTLKVLRHYSVFRDRYHPSGKSTAFLLSERGDPLHYDTVNETFVNIRDRLGWKRSDDGRAPRIHDLRHSFACQRLLEWYREDVDVEHAILALSTYLGHTAVACTYWYLTGVPELLAIGAARFQHFAHGPQGDDHE